jgi:hypothetical protein
MKYAELIIIVIRTISGCAHTYAIELPKGCEVTINPRTQMIGKWYARTTRPYTDVMVACTYDPFEEYFEVRDYYLPGVVVSMRSAEIQIG